MEAQLGSLDIPQLVAVLNRCDAGPLQGAGGYPDLTPACSLHEHPCHALEFLFP